MQLELKHRREMADLIQNKEETLTLRKQFMSDEQKDLELAQKRHEARFQFAHQIRSEIDQREEARRLGKKVSTSDKAISQRRGENE
jgi:hypothetical protein